MDTPASYQCSYDYAADRQDREDARVESIAADLLASADWVHDALKQDAQDGDLIWDMAVRLAKFRGNASVDQSADFVDWLIRRLDEQAVLVAKEAA